MHRRITVAGTLLLLPFLLGIGLSHAQTEPEEPQIDQNQGMLSSSSTRLSNSIMPVAPICFENGQSSRFEVSLDLVLFDQEGIIARRIAVEGRFARGALSREAADLADLSVTPSIGCC